jgi:pSer/pThr/pTyr-binding forkhead associated (FHA) protein
MQGRQLIELDRDRYSVGKAGDNDIALDWDPAVSRTHAVLERVGSRWAIQDLSSTNGTIVNGERIVTSKMLRDDDEIILGRTRLRFADRETASMPSTERTSAAPKLTPTEHKVLIELCRPLLGTSAFTLPASTREIAERLYVGEPAIKQHLAHLYDKFDIIEDNGTTPPRRVRLANAALESGAVKLGDLRDGEGR